ncbi:hypothetical protein EJB05_05581, partial [Eragrostis curvula]
MDAAGIGSPSSRPLRIVIFPWLAFGHMHPYLELAERLASRGHRVSFVSTPRNIARLPAAPRVDMVALPLPRVDGLPDGAESTNSVPAEKFILPIQAFDGLAAPFKEFLDAACADEETRPDWIIVDSFHHWTAAAAVERKVPCAMLQPAAAALASWTSQSSVPRYERKQTARANTNHGAHGLSLGERFSLTREKCTLLAMRSCVEWEGEAFTLAASILSKPLGKKVGLQVPRDENDGSFDRHGVASTVRAVMLQEEERRAFVANARKAQEVVADKELQERYVDEFVQHLRSYATTYGNFHTS